MNNELRKIMEETGEYTQGLIDGILLVAEEYNIELSEAFKEKLKGLLEIMSLNQVRN